MTPHAIIQAAAADGVRLTLTAAGTLKTIGHPDAVQRWVPRLREHKAALAEILAHDPATATAPRWWIHFTDREPLELHTAPPMTHAEILAAYPGAVAAEPVPERVTRAATVIERAELLALVAAIYAADPDADRAEALGAALADPEAALTCYRAIANERGIEGAQKVAGAVAGCNPKKAPPGCSTCRHRKRPGRADPGYCGGGRDDLPPAYGLHHPLRKLPDDQGASCTSYQTIED